MVDKQKPILVKCVRYRTREEILKQKKKSTDFYISEDLTKNRNMLFILAKEERGDEKKFQHVWTHDGRIKIRLHNVQVRSITTTTELA